MINILKGITFYASLTVLVLLTSCKEVKENKEPKKKDGHPSMERIWKDLDTNGDEKIARDEVKGPLKRDFDKIDTNNDDYISKDELSKAPKPDRTEPHESRHPEGN